MQSIVTPLSSLAEFETIKNNLHNGEGVLQITGCIDSQKTHLIYALAGQEKYRLILCAGESKAKDVYEEYSFLDSNVYYYPAKDILFYQADIRGKELLSQRMEVVRGLMADEPMTIVASVEAMLDGLLPLSVLQGRMLCLETGQDYSLSSIEETLAFYGYERAGQVVAPGQFAVRGGIIDIYGLNEEVPFRIEFWGDEIDSIRSFDGDSQRSIENLEKVVLYPATEFYEEKGKHVSFLEYFSKENVVIFLDEPNRLWEKTEKINEEFIEAQTRRVESGGVVTQEDMLLFSVEELQEKLSCYSLVGLSMLEGRVEGVSIRGEYGLTCRQVGSYNGSFETLTKDLKALKRQKYQTVLLCGSRTRARRLAEDLRDYSLSSYYDESKEAVPGPGEILVTYGHVKEGYEYPLIRFRVLSETNIFGRVRKKRRRKRYEGVGIQNYTELSVGDYVVHESHGLGIYQGIEKMKIDGVIKDYFKITYAGGGNLYIPVTQMNLIQKYASADAKKPKLNTLGGVEWKKTKSKVRGAVKEIAKELVELYAKRQEQEGYPFSGDSVWQREFEEMFPFEETEDQLRAIEDTKKDMESFKIMDRLICGDVGYGKTEVAIRAAFKAVQDSKQVVFLVPTTILAQQHYNTFLQRLKEFPVRVDLLCRFRTPAQQKKTLEDLKKGLVDIVIGTHRLLSKDVEFKNLGLLIVDEEQRFGVKHKEQIKTLRQNVDVLTLTATPIPRTLHMSLIGIRDMSVLEEAPMDRMPIQTYVMEFNEEMVREAIEREMQRNGQVYYVYNKVEDIAQMAGQIQKLVPDAIVAFAHGQMRERQLEDIMYDFIDGQIDVLVSTTIIETGLDIPNANTIIIHDADRFGLSTLYQLRGRVGRSNKMAYAFFLYRRNKMLREVAEKRLSAIREFTDLGSGFKIAMRDLEIRGAGNLLGAQQHGHMEAVGYDLYCKMLNEAVRQLKGEIEEEEEFVTSIDLAIDAYIPPSYIANEFQKLDIYKRIAAIETEEEKEDMLEELIDRFGDPPRKVQQLLTIARLKALAHEGDVVSVEQKQEQIYFYMYEKARIQVEKIPELLQQFSKELRLVQGPPVCFVFQRRNQKQPMGAEECLLKVKEILNAIKTLRLPEKKAIIDE